MANLFDDLVRITDPSTNQDLRRVAIREFAEQLRWTPSYEFTSSYGSEAAVDHVIVEHGLENSAVLSFLRAPHRTGDLDQAQLRSLLAISYNNLVEWHLFVSQSDLRTINNLAPRAYGSFADTIYPISPSDFESRLSPEGLADLFRTVKGQRSIAACDDALINVIRRWKRLLSAEIPDLTNASISTLFNALIFVRGCEDRHGDRRRDLLRIVSDESVDAVDIRAALLKGLELSGVKGDLGSFVSLDRLEPFSSVDRATAQNLVRDFYTPRDAPYDFDFALMSKHALSRIYERYVVLLKEDETDRNQFSFITPLPVEEKPTKTGAVYTPQFIAGFFARYVRDNTTPRQFRSLRSLDPACGSGIFLRTLLELQCNPFDPAVTKSAIQGMFAGAVGIDRDVNAAEATKLSLALLYLVVTGELPDGLNVENSEAISQFLNCDEAFGTFDVILTNPPYVKQEHLSNSDIETYRAFLGEGFKGRIDAYLVFMKLCLDSLSVAGIGCFVLPQTFLNSANGAAFRSRISKEFDVRCLVDLSAVDVFDGVGAYSILLVVQRRKEDSVSEGTAQVCRASGLAGPALQAVLDNQIVESPYYSVYEVSQDFFKDKDWAIIPPAFVPIAERLRRLPRLSSYARAVQGFVSGADSVFIRNKNDVPADEMAIYLSFLSDREIGKFRVPAETDEVVFFPYLGATPIEDEQLLAERFPDTWAYLSEHQGVLSARRRSPGTPWWRPERPRTPEVMRRPKIVCPHLMLTPRFALDREGEYAVSRTPFIIAREESDQGTLLTLLTAFLNSSAVSWYIQANAPKYANSYNRIEVGILNGVPVPNLASIDSTLLRRTLDLVRTLEREQEPQSEMEVELDDLVGQIYGFDLGDRTVLRGGSF